MGRDLTSARDSGLAPVVAQPEVRGALAAASAGLGLGRRSRPSGRADPFGTRTARESVARVGVARPQRQTVFSSPITGGPASLELALDLVLCGLLIAGLTYWGHCLQSDFSRVTLYAGAVTGAVCVACGVARLKSRAWRAATLLSLAGATVVLGLQSFQSWRASTEAGPPVRITAIFMTVMVVATLGTLDRVARFRNPRPAASASDVDHSRTRQSHHG